MRQGSRSRDSLANISYVRMLCFVEFIAFAGPFAERVILDSYNARRRELLKKDKGEVWPCRQRQREKREQASSGACLFNLFSETITAECRV